MRPPDAEGADADLHRGALLLDLGVERLHEAVDVVAPPVGALQSGRLTEFLPGRVVGKGRAFYRIRIEIIVDMHAIDGIAAHHVEHRVEGVLPRLGEAGIDPEQGSITPYPLRVSVAE